MGPNLTKAEKTIAVAAVVAIAVFFGVFSILNRKTSIKAIFDTETGINYKMAKPDEAFAEYTLEGRDIDQVYEGLTPAEQKVMAKKKQEMIAKKKEEIKKQEDKKKQTAATQAQAKAKAQQ